MSLYLPNREELVLDDTARDLLFREARTANTFADEPVTDEQIQAIYDLVKWAPTSANLQPLRVLIIRSAEAKARLLPLMADGNRAKTGTAPAVAIVAADTEFHEHIPRIFPQRPEMKDYFGDAAVREPFARFNATLQTGYFILAVRAVGLAAGPMAGFDAEGVDREFFAGTPLKSLLVINIGKPGPDAWFPRLPRLDYEDVITTI
ncbi:MAG TPA: malonic semialdehyde reductase [Chloroflexota bacterium]|jgi:nitroreductase|nr:malonic semialdehyde reductase [Chloroflexota bacterium]